MPALPAYPQILTQSDWNNKKGVVAKIVAVPTQLGDALKKTETAYGEVPWSYVFDAPPADLAKITARLFEYGKQVPPKYAEFTKALAAAKTLAKKVKDDWGKIKLIPAASKTHLDNLIKAFDTFAAAVDTQMKAALKVLTDTKDALAKLNPNEAKTVGDSSDLIKGDKGKPAKDPNKLFKLSDKGKADMAKVTQEAQKRDDFNAKLEADIKARQDAAKRNVSTAPTKPGAKGV